MSQLLTETEQLLLDQVRAGDHAGWDQLVERFQGRLLAFARKQLPQPADAEDTVERQPSRPNFSILFYPVVTMKDGAVHRGSRRNLVGAAPKASLLERYSNESRVTKQTPPTFLLHCTDDRAVPVENSRSR